MGRKYGMEYWLEEIEREERVQGRERFLKIADEFLSRDERKLIREKLEGKGIEYKTRF